MRTFCVKALAGLLLAAPAGLASSADTYRWVDEKGVVTYGEKPPAGVRARPVDTRPGANVIDTGGQFDRKPAAGREPGPDPRAYGPPPPPPPAPQATAVRGMEFDVYIRLQRGMTEGELLLRAGRPDYASVESFRHDIEKTFYYFPTVANPFTTAVRLRGGRIHDIERVRKF